MPQIKPVSEMRNYNSVLSCVSEGEPVYLTKNGYGKYAVYTIEEAEKLEKDRASLLVMLELNKGMNSGEKEGWLTADQVKEELQKLRSKAVGTQTTASAGKKT